MSERPSLDELMQKAATPSTQIAFAGPEREGDAPPLSEEYLEEILKSKDKTKAFFSEEMSKEELLYYFKLGVENSKEPVIFDIKDGEERIQVEGIREEIDNEERYHGRIDPNSVEDNMDGINVYINGRQVVAQEFCEFIEEHKKEFVAACNNLFPNMAELVIIQEKDLKLEEKEHIISEINMTGTVGSSVTRTATQEEQHKAQDLDEMLKKAALDQGRQEMRYAQDRLFDSAPKVNANFYIMQGTKADMIEFSKFQTKDGKERTIMKINGEYVGDREMAEYLAKHPGQIKQQVDVYIATHAKVNTKKKADQKQHGGEERKMQL